MKTAQDLWDAGYRVTSRKYRLVARVPPGMSGREAVESVAPGQYHPGLSSAACAEQFRRVYSTESLTVPPALWADFLKLHSAWSWDQEEPKPVVVFLALMTGPTEESK